MKRYYNTTLPFKTFGKKDDVDYFDREGTYIIPIKDNEVCIVHTQKGYFLIGGGISEGESEKDCLIRECLEETGCNVIIREKFASAETYCRHVELGYFHPIQHYYLGELSVKVQEPIESGHELKWINIEEIEGKMFLKMQEWAIQRAYESFARKSKNTN